jgi:hypothetical protein
MLMDAAQSAHADDLPKLMQHTRGGTGAPQPGEAPPRGLFGQLHDQQVERMRRGQQGQQMRAPKLGCAQNVTPSTGKVARTDLGNEVIGHERAEPFKQMDGANGRQSRTHA